jgi:hypothetical protein
LLNPIFDIKNINSLSINNLPNFELHNTPACYYEKTKQSMSEKSEKFTDVFNVDNVNNENNGNNGNNENNENNENNKNNKNNENNGLLEELKKNKKENIDLTKLRWVKNKKSRFYILEDNNSSFNENENENENENVTGPLTPSGLEGRWLPEGTPAIEKKESPNKDDISTDLCLTSYTSSIAKAIDSYQGKAFDTSKGKHRNKNKSVLIGFLFQPIQEFEQMSNFDLKKYTYESNQTTFNLSNIKKENFATHLQSNGNVNYKPRFYPWIFGFSTPLQSRSLHFEQERSEKRSENVNYICQLPLQLYKYSKGGQKEEEKKTKKEIFINKSFDSLSKKRLYRTKTTYKLESYKTLNSKVLKEINYTRQLQSQLSKYSKGKKIKVSSLFFIFTKNKELMKTITSHRNLFINKTGFKHSDWKKIGLLHSNTYSNNISCLQPKYPKDDFTIVSNVLIKNYVQQYYNFEHLFKKSSHIFMVSRKPLNLSPFLISYRNLSNQPMSFNFHALMRSINAKPEIKAFKAMQLQNKGKKPFFKLSYSPISNFDYILYPSLSSQIINILNSYLIHSTIKNENKMDLLSPKQRFYSSFNNIIKNIFEAPCFMFSLTQSFDFSTLNKNNT